MNEITIDSKFKNVVNPGNLIQIKPNFFNINSFFYNRYFCIKGKRESLFYVAVRYGNRRLVKNLSNAIMICVDISYQEQKFSSDFYFYRCQINAIHEAEICTIYFETENSEPKNKEEIEEIFWEPIKKVFKVIHNEEDLIERKESKKLKKVKNG